MQQDLVSSAGDPNKLRTWLAANRKLRTLLKKYDLRRTRRTEWSVGQRVAALEAVDALPKALRRAKWIKKKQAEQEESDERQGQDRIKQLVRKIDVLLKPRTAAKPQRRLGGSRNELIAYLRGAERPDTWRDLIRMLDGDLRLAVRLRDSCDYSLADAMVALQPSGFAEQVTWPLAAKRFRGRFRLTPNREQALMSLRAALEALPSNARAGRPESAAKPLIRAAVLVWKAFGRPMEFRFSSAHDRVSGAVVDFLRDLLTLAKLRVSDAALNQQLRTLRSV